MAMYEGFKRVEGSRSHTGLIKSGHMSPAEEFLLDGRFQNADMSSVFRDGVLFTYQYGGPGQEEVVIPMGRVVGVHTPIKDFRTKKFKTVLTLPGMSLANNVVGMVPYNITKDWFQLDRFGGNQPSIITMDYVELPFMPGCTPAATNDRVGLLEEEQAISLDLKMPYGAVIGDVNFGDYVMATASGRLKKWNGVNAMDVVGQVVGGDMNSEPMGWLKWAMWDNAAKYEDDAYVNYLNKSGASNLPSDGGYPYDANINKGTREMAGYQSRFVTNPTGVPGLHDGTGNFIGFGKNDTPFENMNLGVVPAITSETYISFQAKDYAGGVRDNLQEGVKVFLDGVEVAVADLIVDYKKGIFSIKVDAVDAGKTVTATYKAFQFGTRSTMDFKGVVGSYNILLRK